MRNPLPIALPALSAVLLVTATPALATRFSAPRTAQSSGELERLVLDQIAVVETAPTEQIWSRAASVRGVAKELDAGSIDPVLESLLEGDLSPRATLFLASARLQGSDPDAAQLFTALRGLRDSEDDAIALGALGLLADPQFKALRGEERDALREDLLAILDDGERDPRVRLEAAHALHVHGDGESQRHARRTLLAFLESSSPDLRGLGALALARTGSEVTGNLLDELERLAQVPGERGQLAESYLKQERIREETNRKLKRIEDWYERNSVQQVEEKADPAAWELLRQVQSVIDMVKRSHLDGDKVEDQQLLDAALDGMLQSLDQHSSYFAPREFDRFEQSLEGGYGGIGAYVATDRTDQLFTITRPIYSGPAWRQGIRSDDKIVRIDDWPTIGKTQDEIIKRLKGRPGTSVRLFVWKRGMDPSLIERPTEEMAVVVTREAITIPPLAYEMMPGGIGLVQLREFSRVATRELRDVLLGDLAEHGMRGLVLDLRSNPGGLLDEARDVCGLFLPKGSLVVTTESRIAASHRVVTKRDPVLPDLPVTVLINRYSASASEIVAGALQVYGRAEVVGERSFGKGSVQNLIRVDGTRDDNWMDENKNGRHDNWERLERDHNGNGEFDFAPRLKLTVARYRLPDGTSIHRELDEDLNIISPGGVQPDHEVSIRRTDTWRLDEMYRLARRDNRPRDYADQYYDENAELFAELAYNDHRDVSRYPGFEEFYAGLGTPLPRDDVRALLRGEIRRRVQDERGRELTSDFVEDLQLQKAIELVLAQVGEAPDQIEDYAEVFRPQPEARIAVVSRDKSQVADALRRIEEARRGDGRLDPETLEELTQLLEESVE